MNLLGDDRATEHRGFIVDVTIPSETVAGIVCRTFVALPEVSGQADTLVNILCGATCHLFHNVASPGLFDGSVFLKTK